MNDNQALFRAIRGPVILIAIGTLFALDHAGLFRFHQTWPALIILIGLLKLAEWAIVKPTLPPPPPPLPPGGMQR